MGVSVPRQVRVWVRWGVLLQWLVMRSSAHRSIPMR
jgi:hypothetical protein